MIEDIFPRKWFANYENIKELFDNDYGYPEFDTLRDEICKCLILDLNVASITLTNHLLEDFLKKILIYKSTPKNQDSIIGIFDISTDKYNSISLYDSIEKSYEEGLISEIQKELFHQFRNKFRNPYSHADSNKIFQNMTVGAQELKLEDDKINTSDYKKIDITRLPFFHGIAKIQIAEELALKYFNSVDSMIREVLEEIKNAHNLVARSASKH
jgi:hypothetical protein